MIRKDKNLIHLGSFGSAAEAKAAYEHAAKILFGKFARHLSAMIIAACFCGINYAKAGENITVREAISLAQALRNLDGHMVVVKQNGAEQTVMVPWEFGSGSLRLRIASDLTILSAVEADLEKTRQNIVKEIEKQRAVAEIKPGTPDYDEFMKQYSDALDQPAAGTQDLARIKSSDLKLDKNEIGVTVLQAMHPILDADK